MVLGYPGKDSRTLLREKIKVETNSCLFSQLSVALGCFNRQEICGVQGWRSGLSTRLSPMWPEFDSQIRRHMWVEFVGSLLCTERFSPGTPVSPLLQNQHLVGPLQQNHLICVNLLISVKTFTVSPISAQVLERLDT